MSLAVVFVENIIFFNVVCNRAVLDESLVVAVVELTAIVSLSLVSTCLSVVNVFEPNVEVCVSVVVVCAIVVVETLVDVVGCSLVVAEYSAISMFDAVDVSRGDVAVTI